MNAPLLPDWPAVFEAGAGEAGGKAWTLARLARLDFPVPPGCVLPVGAYRRWLADGGLEAELLAAADEADPDALAALAQRLAAVPLPDGFAAALRERLAAAGWRELPLAVRSSAPQEDSAAASFAGIHASCLNVQGETALGRAIVAVWSSLWTPAAVAYRRRRGIAHADAAMAVLVMPLVGAVASGIGFTCDPVSGRDDRVVIHANWGLGESLVGGAAAGDEIVLGEDERDDALLLLAYRSGTKAVASRPAAGGGTANVPAAAAEARARVLDDAQALELGELLRLAAFALDLARPAFDCEWAWDGARFWLLQARPVTASGRCTYPELNDQPDIWTRGNTKDVVPDPLSPMDWGASRRLVNALLTVGYRAGGFPLQPGAQRAGLFHGRLYLNLSLMQWEGWAGFGVAPDAMNRLVGGHQPEIRVPAADGRRKRARLGILLRYVLRSGPLRRKGLRDVAGTLSLARRWRLEPVPADDAGIARALRAQMRHLRGLETLHFLQGSSGGSLSMLVDFVEALRPGEGHALAAALLAGGTPSVTAEQGYALARIARIAMEDPAARTWLAERERGASGDWRTLPAGNPFRRAFAEFIERYGHRGIYETYLRNPRWRERPDYLLDSLRDLAGTDLEALATRQHQHAAAALAQLHDALPAWKRPLLGFLLGTARSESNGREAARSALIACMEPGRRLLLEIGARWTARGWLSAPEDVFLLHAAEFFAVAEGGRPGAVLPPLVSERRARFEAWQREDPPDVILAHADGATEAIEGRTAPAGDGELLKGVPVGCGLAVGIARVLHSPEEGRRLQPGEILVVPSTDPAWTPLFLKAGGLVMETGGYLSHGAIVAREFGIPAVVNLPGVLDLIADGERLQVDGRSGTVRRLGGLLPAAGARRV